MEKSYMEKAACGAAMSMGNMAYANRGMDPQPVEPMNTPEIVREEQRLSRAIEQLDAIAVQFIEKTKAVCRDESKDTCDSLKAPECATVMGRTLDSFTARINYVAQHLQSASMRIEL